MQPLTSHCTSPFSLLLLLLLAVLLPLSNADIFLWNKEQIEPSQRPPPRAPTPFPPSPPPPHPPVLPSACLPLLPFLDKLKVRSFIEMYTAEDAPHPFWSSSPPFTPSISVDLTFSTIDGSAPPPQAQLEIAVFKASHGLDEYTFRYPLGNEVATTSCCTDVDALKGNTAACPTDTSLYIDPALASDVERWVVKFDGKSTAHVSAAQHVIRDTGEHFLIIADCNAPSLNAFGQRGVEVNGHTQWLNPYGHLMGRLYGYLPFYAIMTLIFGVATALWFAFNLYYRQSLASVQHCITVVLSLCLIESFMWFLDYYLWNASGSRNVTLIIIGILLTVSRLSVSRMLVVAVSLGWGVVRPSLGKNKWRLIALGALYFCCETGLELIQRYSQIDASVEKWRIGLIIPVSVLNSVFYCHRTHSNHSTRQLPHASPLTPLTHTPSPPVDIPQGNKPSLCPHHWHRTERGTCGMRGCGRALVWC